MNLPRILLLSLVLILLTTSCGEPGTQLPSPGVTPAPVVVSATLTLTTPPVPSVTFTPTIQVTATPTTVMGTITPARTPHATNTRQPTAPAPFELADLIGLGQIAFINETGWISVINADGTGVQELDYPGGSHYRYNDECSIAWSPDGKEIAATIDSHIYILNADGSDARKITSELATDFCISWSPDGKLIAFASDRAGIRHPSGQAYFIDIFTIQPDGSNLTKLTPSDGYCDYPDWSPFGKLITYQCIVESFEGMDIYTVGLNGSRQNLTLTGDAYYPNWSPDGKLIAYGISDIYVVPSNGGSAKQLTNSGLGFHPVWSPDGKWIAYLIFEQGGNHDIELFVMESNGNNQRQLTFNQISDVNPSWSPDSKYIVYEQYELRNWPGDLYIVEVSTGSSQLLVKHAGSPVWSPVKGSTIQQLPDCTSGWTRLIAGGKARVAGAPTDPPNRVRSAPSTSSELIGQIYPGTELRLIEGPICADGYVFWKVESEVIPGGTGWTAEGDGKEYFLEPINP